MKEIDAIKEIDFSDIKIEKNIKMPDRKHGKFFDTLRKMEVGDSILLPPVTKRLRANIGSNIKNKLYEEGYKFATRNMSDGLRIWRVEMDEKNNL